MTSKALPIWIIGLLLFLSFMLFLRTVQLQDEVDRLRVSAGPAMSSAEVDRIVSEKVGQSGNPLLPKQGAAYQPPSDITAAYEPALQLPAEGATAPRH